MSEVDGKPAEAADAKLEELELVPPRHRVAERAKRWWAWQAVIVDVVLLGMLAGVMFGVWPLLPTALSVAIVAVGVLWALAYLIVMPIWRYRVHRWETTDEAVYTASGWLWQEWRVAPLSRIQTVDTERGLLQQWFKLSTVTVTTASSAGTIKIEGLDHELAKDLVQHLTSRTQATPGDAT
ncbi:PH domain-containing protein [Amycolatopsis sp. CA-230715]|uniref:PH domain-containing protein n=1 Tax=Amycolatopsis sp. CA-230715 TaxID=2745196 RepID=UPI001C035992|nr:PH domain-containing protein [Amycolatopsis sp. CA-230715]QWF78562.1 hypothetical protein HUW46_01958 [Amycolatopsis sp. CA-230715]